MAEYAAQDLHAEDGEGGDEYEDEGEIDEFEDEEEIDELEDDDCEKPDFDNDLEMLAKDPVALQEQMDFEVRQEHCLNT